MTAHEFVIYNGKANEMSHFEVEKVSPGIGL